MEHGEINAALRMARADLRKHEANHGKLNELKRIEFIMRDVNTILECHGVEGIADRNGEYVAEYVNTGDAYCLTLIYDALVNRFCVESWGDFIERKERTAQSRGGFRTRPDMRYKANRRFA